MARTLTLDVARLAHLRIEPPVPAGARLCATRDHDEIRRWAANHGAEPATGEATRSGAALVDVNDGGVGIRFNFPGFARFRPIAWDEWFENFDRYHLVFVYEEQDRAKVAERAHQLWLARGGVGGSDRDDWLKAEAELRREAGGASPSVRYWIMKDVVEDETRSSEEKNDA